MADDDARLGQQFFERVAHGLDGVDLVVQEVHLAAALEFAQHRLADQTARHRGDESLDGKPAARRGGDHREIAHAFQRQAQRARNRRRGQRQHVDLGAQGLERLLLAHAEAVLLVDDRQAQTGELHILLQQAVGADDDVDLALGHLFERRRLFLGAAKARQFGEPDRPVGEAVGEGLEVLLGQQRGRREYRDLLAVGHRDEGGAQRDFGLAEADVAADQPVHRLARAHVADHGIDRGELVGRFLEAEAVGKSFEIMLLEVELVSLAGCALGVQRQQFGGRVANLRGRALLGLLPLAGTQRVQFDLLPGATPL